MKAIEVPEISTLSIPEKILFLENLWDSISLNEEEIAIPEFHKVELDQRFERYLTSPEKLLTLEELQTRINERKNHEH
ncbi:MAG: addiction module protein [Candidatus Hodarchaeota archaeon]